MQEIDIHEQEKLNHRADQAKSHEEGIRLIENYKKIIRSKNKCHVNVEIRQGKVFKRFKDSEMFGDILKELNIRQPFTSSYI